MSQWNETPEEERWEDVGEVNLHDRWDTIAEAKLAAKVFITDRWELWGTITDSDKRRMNIVCKRNDICEFRLHVGQSKGQFRISVYTPYTLPESLPPDLGSDLTHSEYDSNDDSSSDSNDEARPNPHGDSQFAAIVEHKRKQRALKSQNVLYKKQATSSSRGKEHSKSKSSKQKATSKVASNARVNTKKTTKRNENKGKQVATRASRANFTEEDHALLTVKYESIDAVPDECKDAVWRQLSKKVGLTLTL
jgi:hypothetical protein